ncbi:YciI family protein [Roseiterribacter gracilis]|uniref:YCII-related domain-containing protein n=1 Tax=Roseiterribacter gracilis TaxID=2812848 RepID=A0A8S8XGY0_9PROT|nr:hypothetical protein TMPK1_34490 [Rhodospirillales bacterium TMPK1]
MRCLIIGKATADTEAGIMPTKDEMEEMGAYMAEMQKAGVLLDGAGLKPSSQAARVVFDDAGTPTVIDGPFAETKELIAGFVVVEVKSLEEAIDWAKRAPGKGARVSEIRPYFEPEDFAYLAEQK